MNAADVILLDMKTAERRAAERQGVCVVAR